MKSSALWILGKKNYTQEKFYIAEIHEVNYHKMFVLFSAWMTVNAENCALKKAQN